MRFDENILTDKLGKIVIKCFHSTVPPGRRVYREHHHTECELSLFLSGKGLYHVGERTYEFETGDIFLFNGGEVHCITSILPDVSFNLLNIHFEPRILWSSPELSDMELLKLFFFRNENFEHRIDHFNPAIHTVRSLILRLEEELKDKRPSFELVARMNLNYILVLLLREFDYVRDDHFCNDYTHAVSQLEIAMNFIDSNLENPITLDELARQAAVSPTYFSTLFKKFNGISPWEYITIKRVEKAIRLLETTSMTKLDIAGQCGFNSSSNFYKAFHKVTGKTPGEFSKWYRSAPAQSS